MEKISDRILKIVDTEKISIRHLEQIIGCSNGVLSKSIKKGTDISTFWISKIIEVLPYYDANWLLTGIGDMLKRIPETESNHKRIDNLPANEIFTNSGELILKMAEEIGSLKEQIRSLKSQLGYTNNNKAAES